MCHLMHAVYKLTTEDAENQEIAKNMRAGYPVALPGGMHVGSFAPNQCTNAPTPCMHSFVVYLNYQGVN